MHHACHLCHFTINRSPSTARLPATLPSHRSLTDAEQARIQTLETTTRIDATSDQTSNYSVLHGTHVLSILLSYCTLSDLLTRCKLEPHHTHSQIIDHNDADYLRIHSVQALHIHQQHRSTSITVTEQSLHPRYAHFTQRIRAHPFITSLALECPTNYVRRENRETLDLTATLPQITSLHWTEDPLLVYKSLSSFAFCDMSPMCHGVPMASCFAHAEFERQLRRITRSSYPLLEQQHPYLQHLAISVNFSHQKVRT